MSVKLAEQQIRKSQKLTLRQFPERDQHVANLEQYAKLTKAGQPPTHEWQRRSLGYVFAGTPDVAAATRNARAQITAVETLAEARAWDARKARLVNRGYSHAEAARAAWAA